MKFFLSTLCLAALAAGSTATIAAEGETLYAGVENLQRSGTLSADEATVETVAVEGESFTTARRVTTHGAPKERWDIALAEVIDFDVKQGDVIALSFSARTAEAMTEQGLVSVALEQNFEPHRKVVSAQFGPPRGQWQQYDVPVVAQYDLDAGAAQVTFHLGFSQQTVDIADLRIVRYAAGTDVTTLPRTPLYYRGMEDDAAWRVAALERIEAHRKADLKIVVINAAGKPMADQEVQVTMDRLDFQLGAAVSARAIISSGAKEDTYRKVIADHFNTIVFENDLKWHEDAARLDDTEEAIAWLAERDIAVRGHVLLWPSYRFTPKFLQDLSPEEVQAAIYDRIDTLSARFAGRLVDWDVINEPYNNTDYEKLLGRELFVECFKRARAGDPHARLFLNDWGILSSGNKTDTDHQQHFYDMVRYLQDNDAPIDGIGFQGHFASTLTEPENLLAIYDRFADLGLPIVVSEFDISIGDRDVQASYMRDFLTAAFSHRSVDGVLQWGFYENRHWQPQAALYDKDWNLLPHGKVFLDLLDEWRTDATLTTDNDGTATLRAYRGNYTIQMGQQRETFTLPEEGATLTLTIQ